MEVYMVEMGSGLIISSKEEIASIYGVPEALEELDEITGSYVLIWSIRRRLRVPQDIAARLGLSAMCLLAMGDGLVRIDRTESGWAIRTEVEHEIHS